MWKIHQKVGTFNSELQIKTEASNRKYQHQVETSNLQGHAWCILTVKLKSLQARSS